MVSLATVIVLYAIAVVISAILIVGLDRYVDLDRRLGLDPWRRSDLGSPLSIGPDRSETVEDPAVCPDCGVVNEADFAYCCTCVSKLPHARA